MSVITFNQINNYKNLNVFKEERTTVEKASQCYQKVRREGDGEGGGERERELHLNYVFKAGKGIMHESSGRSQ